MPKINFRSIKIYIKMIKPLDENVDYLYDFDISKDFLNRTPKVLTIKGKNGKFDYIKIKNVCSSENSFRGFRS